MYLNVTTEFQLARAYNNIPKLFYYIQYCQNRKENHKINNYLKYFETLTKRSRHNPKVTAEITSNLMGRILIHYQYKIWIINKYVSPKKEKEKEMYVPLPTSDNWSNGETGYATKVNCTASTLDISSPDTGNNQNSTAIES